METGKGTSVRGSVPPRPRCPYASPWHAEVETLILAQQGGRCCQGPGKSTNRDGFQGGVMAGKGSLAVVFWEARHSTSSLKAGPCYLRARNIELRSPPFFRPSVQAFFPHPLGPSYSYSGHKPFFNTEPCTGPEPTTLNHHNLPTERLKMLKLWGRTLTFGGPRSSPEEKGASALSQHIVRGHLAEFPGHVAHELQHRVAPLPRETGRSRLWGNT